MDPDALTWGNYEDYVRRVLPKVARAQRGEPPEDRELRLDRKVLGER